MNEESPKVFQKALDAGMLAAEIRLLMFEAIWRSISKNLRQMNGKKKEALRRQLLEAIASTDDSFFIIPEDVTMTRKDLVSHLASMMDDPSRMRRLRRDLASGISAQGSRLTDYLLKQG